MPSPTGSTAAVPTFCRGISSFADPWPDFDRLASIPAIGSNRAAITDPAEEAAVYQTLLAADALRYLTLQMAASKASGHPGGYASSAEAHAALIMLGHKNIITEAGHHAPGYYAALHLDGSLEEIGIASVDDLMARFRERDGLLGHVTSAVPGMLAPAGPLGQGQHFAMAAALAHRDVLFPVTIGDGGMGEPYVLSSMMNFHVAYPGVTNFLPVLVWNGHSQEHHSMVSRLDNEQMAGHWKAHGFDEVIVVDAADFSGQSEQREAFIDSTALPLRDRLAFARRVLVGLDQAAGLAMTGRLCAVVIKQLKGSGAHAVGAASHNLYPNDTLDAPRVIDALQRRALSVPAWMIVRDNFLRAGGGPAAQTVVTEIACSALEPPDITLEDFAHGENVSPAQALGSLLVQTASSDPEFIVTGADGTRASAMAEVVDELGIRHPTSDRELNQGPAGRLYEPVNEDSCAGLAAGTALFGGRSVWMSYESFGLNGWPVVQTVTQAMAELRRRVPSVVTIFTAGALEQGRNGWTHQRPEIEGYVVAQMRNGNVYGLFPCDANTAQAAYVFATREDNKGMVIFASKSPLPVRIPTSEAQVAIETGAVTIADTGPEGTRRVVLAVVGDLVLAPAMAAVEELGAAGVAARVVSVVNPRRLFRPEDLAWKSAAEPDGVFLGDDRFESLFGGEVLLGVAGGSSAPLEPVLLRSRARARDVLCWQRGETVATFDDLLAVNGLTATDVVDKALALLRRV